VFSWSSHIKERRARARPSQPDGTPERGTPTTVGHPGIYQTLTKKVKWVVVGTPGSGVEVFARPSEPEAPQQVTVDSVPSGEVDIRRDLTVCATDGEIGQVQGLVVEPGGHQVTHVLLPAGHLRGRKEVAIPISAVTKIGTMLIHLGLTKHQVKDLPPVAID
jgi:sporulation protein YlmC with PRC-barrel domain